VAHLLGFASKERFEVWHTFVSLRPGWLGIFNSTITLNLTKVQTKMTEEERPEASIPKWSNTLAGRRTLELRMVIQELKK
jgi:hypothetical protein